MVTFPPKFPSAECTQKHLLYFKVRVPPLTVVSCRQMLAQRCKNRILNFFSRCQYISSSSRTAIGSYSAKVEACSFIHSSLSFGRPPSVKMTTEIHAA